MQSKNHWEQVYTITSADALSWYAPHLDDSLEYIRRTGVPLSAPILDVGGSESTLVDDLLEAGYKQLSVLDISSKALDVCRARLSPHLAAKVRWLATDVLQHSIEPQSVDVWHDRAVIHFLTAPDQRHAYVAQVLKTLRPGGFAIVGAFGPQGPTQCSGLSVSRYSTDALHAEFGSPFRLLDHNVVVHTTPWGAEQQFVYCFCRLEH